MFSVSGTTRSLINPPCTHKRRAFSIQHTETATNVHNYDKLSLPLNKIRPPELKEEKWRLPLTRMNVRRPEEMMVIWGYYFKSGKVRLMLRSLKYIKKIMFKIFPVFLVEIRCKVDASFLKYLKGTVLIYVICRND